MKEKTALVYNPDIRNYHFGEAHPFKGERFEIFVTFLKKKVLNFKDYFEEIKPEPATDANLKLAHSQEYIEAIKKASKGIILPDILRYATADNLDPLTGYLPKNIDEAARLIVGSSMLAGELVLTDKYKKAIVIGGGLHHAKRERGEGFCIYNDVVICAKNLLNLGLKKILILDTDAHAGNGTAEAFYEDGRVLFVDLHQDPKTIYPGTGFINQLGRERGEGFTINIPLPAGAGDAAYQYCFEKIIFPLGDEFKADVIIRNGGSDPYFDDILTNLGLTLEGFKIIGGNVRKLAEICRGKVIDLIASGYNQEVLPYAWLAIISSLLDIKVEIEEPSKKRVPPRNSKLEETKEVIKELKETLRKYWKCFR